MATEPIFPRKALWCYDGGYYQQEHNSNPWMSGLVSSVSRSAVASLLRGVMSRALFPPPFMFLEHMNQLDWFHDTKKMYEIRFRKKSGNLSYFSMYVVVLSTFKLFLGYQGSLVFIFFFRIWRAWLNIFLKFYVRILIRRQCFPQGRHDVLRLGGTGRGGLRRHATSIKGCMREPTAQYDV